MVKLNEVSVLENHLVSVFCFFRIDLLMGRFLVFTFWLKLIDLGLKLLKEFVLLKLLA